MRADGAVALAVTAFGLSFIGGMQLADHHVKAPNPSTAQAATGEHVTLADAQALPGLAAVPKPKPTPAPTPQPKAKPKPKKHRATPKPSRTVRLVAAPRAPVVRSAPAPVATAAPRPVSTPVPQPRQVSTPRPVRTPAKTPTPAPSFDDNGQPNSFSDGGSGP